MTPIASRRATGLWHLTDRSTLNPRRRNTRSISLDSIYTKKMPFVFINNHYEVEHYLGVTNDLNVNMHEFNIVNGGNTALACTYRPQKFSLAGL